MYEVIKRQRIAQDGTVVDTFTREVEDDNILQVEAGTTGYREGEAEIGAVTYFRMADLDGTDIAVRPLGDDGNGGFEVVLHGDGELASIILALKFIVKVLEEESEEVFD